MNLYTLSSFNTLQHLGNKSTYENSVTGKGVLYSSYIIELINSIILKQQIAVLADDLNTRIFQIITCELLYRGIIVPVDKIDTEIEYLSSLIKIRKERISFFKSNNISEVKIELLDKEDKNVIFCGIPYDIGAKNPGTRFGPYLLRDRSNSIMFRHEQGPCLLDIYSNSNIFFKNFVYDFGDINLDMLSKREALQRVKDIASLISRNGIPFFIGGDHLFTFPIVEGIYKERGKVFSFVQFDYHLDIQVWGNFKDNKPEVLTSPTHSNFVSWIHNNIPELKKLQIGVDNYQSITRKNSRNIVNYLEMVGSRISNIEIYKSPIEQICTKLPKGEDIYISIDVDVLNLIYINSTGYPAPTGISFKDFMILISYLCQHNTIIGVDIMEFGQNNKVEHHLYMSTIVVNIILEILKHLKWYQ